MMYGDPNSGVGIPFRRRIAASLAGLGAAGSVAAPLGASAGGLAAGNPLTPGPVDPYHVSDRPMVGYGTLAASPMRPPGPPMPPQEGGHPPLVGTPPWPPPWRNSQPPLPRQMGGMGLPRQQFKGPRIAKPNRLAASLMGF